MEICLSSCCHSQIPQTRRLSPGVGEVQGRGAGRAGFILRPSDLQALCPAVSKPRFFVLPGQTDAELPLPRLTRRRASLTLVLTVSQDPWDTLLKRVLDLNLFHVLRRKDLRIQYKWPHNSKLLH